MGGIISLVGILALAIWLIRYLRKREIEAFMEADLSVFQEFAAGRDDNKGMRLAEESVVVAGNVVNLRGPRPDALPAMRFVAKDAIFDEVHRKFLTMLEKSLDDRLRVFVHTPLSDFLRIESGSADLRDKVVSFLVCDKSRLKVVCGVMLQGNSPSEVERFRFLEGAFNQIGRPLVAFSVTTEPSLAEVREKIGRALGSAPESRTCPRCGGEMSMRKVVKGVNAGKSFWVCKEFPGCRGVMRAGRW